uniref:Uncharacterized protein n=1 Tax=Octopus bimaculoides TaxID=37653 RepID=A0A0L8IBW8_OCTBM
MYICVHLIVLYCERYLCMYVWSCVYTFQLYICDVSSFSTHLAFSFIHYTTICVNPLIMACICDTYL